MIRTGLIGILSVSLFLYLIADTYGKWGGGGCNPRGGGGVVRPASKPSGGASGKSAGKTSKKGNSGTTKPGTGEGDEEKSYEVKWDTSSAGTGIVVVSGANEKETMGSFWKNNKNVDTGIQRIDSQEKAEKPHIVLYFWPVQNEVAGQNSLTLEWYAFNSEECYKLSEKFSAWKVDVKNADEKILKKNKINPKKVPVVVFYDRFGTYLFSCEDYKIEAADMQKLMEKALKMDEQNFDKYGKLVKELEGKLAQAKELIGTNKANAVKVLLEIVKANLQETQVFKDALEALKKIYWEEAETLEKEGKKANAVKAYINYRDYTKGDEYEKATKKIESLK